MKRTMRAATKLVGCTALLSSALILQACSGLQAANSLYNGAKNLTTMYHAQDMLKDLGNAQPVFKDYNSVLVMADISPRSDSGAITQAWIGNMSDYGRAVAGALRAPLIICTIPAQCSGRVVVAQFREEAYDANVVQKYTLGSKIRGKIMYLDQASGRVLHEGRAELADDYAALAKPVSASLLTTMYKSFPPASGVDNEKLGKELQNIPPLFPQYEKPLKTS